MRRFRLHELFPGVTHHLGRRTLAVGETVELHRHDFSEVFWLESGSMRHEVNGRLQRLGRGDAVFIRPTDAHALRGDGVSGCTIVNFALPSAAALTLDKRYDLGYWRRDARLPRVVSGLEGRGLDRLAIAVDSLPPTFREARHRDWLLLTLHDLLVSSRDARKGAGNPAVHQSPVPTWLAEAVGGMTPDDLREGMDALARRAGRSREHLSREMTRHFGRSTSRWINDRRLDLAARALGMGDRPILDICFDCGFENLSYFYRLFGQRFHMSPRRYRLNQSRLLH